MKWLLAFVVCAPLTASAFCGFYVSGAGSQLYNDASMVVLVRDGTRTVLSMQNNYRGPLEDFALVVPVPVVLQKGNVTTLPREAFTRLDELTAPRLVEMSTETCLSMRGALQGANVGAGAGGSSSLPRDLGVTVEATFNVEEYEIVILSAESSLGLQIWLKENKYKIPDGAEAALKPYVQGGSKFFVAKVDAKKAKFKNGALVLSPLRFHYDTDAFSLPVRLGLLNSSGTQDLIVNIIGMSRYEVANAKNVLVPTNFDVRTRTQPQFGGFYSELVDRTFKKNPRAALTEFAWEGALPPPTEMVGGGVYGVTCDPCPPPHPVDNPLAKYLGVKLMPKIKTDEGVAAFARNATLTRLHLRYTKDSAPDDLVFKAVEPIAGGTPEVKTPGPAKHNRFQGRYVMWVEGCAGGGLGGLGGFGFFSAPSPLNQPQATSTKLIDPLEQLILADLPELDVKAQPLSKDAPKVTYERPAPPPPQFVQTVAGRPTVVLGAANVQGPLARDVVMNGVRRLQPQLQGCYNQALTVNPNTSGKVSLKLFVSASGTVANAAVSSSTTGSQQLDQCLLQRLRQIALPQVDEGNTQVELPLMLRSQ